MSPSVPPSDSITLPAHELQEKLSAGELTSVYLVEQFLAQIDRHNHNGMELNAIISACPANVAVCQARRLDNERKAGRIRGKLHGIPIVLKDAIVTDPSLGMVTSAGSFAVASLKARRNATLVERLIDAGLIILGKANMTEFCGHKSNNTPLGWSAYGGQTRSAYRREDLKEEDQPWAAGSSSGSAVSIAAGFTPLAIGTETGGSNVFPASVSGLYGLTLTRGSAPTDGVFKISETYDSIGVMARDPVDLAALVEVLLAPEGELRIASGRHGKALARSFEGLSIGVVSNRWGVSASAAEEKWDLPEVKARYEEAVRIMQSKGASVVFPLDLLSAETLEYGDENLMTVAYHEFPGQIEEFLAENFELDGELTNLADVIAWNERHTSQALPEPYTTQTELIASRDNTMTSATHAAAATELRRLAREEGAGRVMDEQGLDIILSPSDANLVGYAACAGWPIATTPLGRLARNGQPWGFFAMAREGREDVLLQFMGAFKESFEAVGSPDGPFT
ncbi:Amidase-like protein [Pleurostoma richardsiae]|uniref:Amidase-like protein n=1 Tax=Pleurostoma richardsiae TaxID=41990 RepID=A0AA38RQS6_9PEZI|nr:Amidase-like protein [Pleurostoma richardsiae]